MGTRTTAPRSGCFPGSRRTANPALSPNVGVRYAAIRLSECLADVLRVAESRGRRLPTPDIEYTDEPCEGTHGTQGREGAADHEHGNGTDNHDPAPGVRS